jgi:hypothetical protein
VITQNYGLRDAKPEREFCDMLYTDLVDLARLKRARLAESPAAADRLMRLAKEYQGRAAELVGGQLPDIGEGLPLGPREQGQDQEQPQDEGERKDPKTDRG